MTTHDDDTPRDALAEARALLENASIDDLQIMSCDGDRVQIADQHGDWFGDLDYTQPEDATLVIDAPRLLRALVDECDALRARCETLEGLAGQYFDEDAEGNFYGRDDREAATEE